jgi:GTP pyrophosphokinase
MDQLKSERQVNIKTGKKMLEEKLSELGHELNDKSINVLMDGLEIFDSKPDEMYYKIGIGLIKLDAIKDILRKWHERPRTVPKEDDRHYYIIASCCHPIPGDSVIGFAASDGTVTVHKRTCKTANNLAAKFGDKIVSVKWDKELNSGSSYLARISLKGTDRIGMINDITRVTSTELNVNIRRFNLGTEDGIFDGHIDLYVHDIDDLENLMLKLRNIKGIESVVRKEL